MFHEAAHRREEGIVARPEVPVRYGGLASLVADFALEFGKEIIGAAGQCAEDTDADGAEFGGDYGEEEVGDQEGEDAHGGCVCAGVGKE